MLCMHSIATGGRSWCQFNCNVPTTPSQQSGGGAHAHFLQSRAPGLACERNAKQTLTRTPSHAHVSTHNRHGRETTTCARASWRAAASRNATPSVIGIRKQSVHEPVAHPPMAPCQHVRSPRRPCQQPQLTDMYVRGCGVRKVLLPQRLNSAFRIAARSNRGGRHMRGARRRGQGDEQRRHDA